MPALHMSIESVKGMNNNIKSSYIELKKALLRMRSEVDNCIGTAWIGSSSNDLNQEFLSWYNNISNQLECLEPLVKKIDSEIDAWESMASLLSSTENLPDSKENQSLLRKWWHGIIRDHGYYNSYGLFLALPSDNELINYVSDFGNEIDLLSGKNCLVLIFGKYGGKNSTFNKKEWSNLVQEYVEEDYSSKLAQLFGIEFTQFPCLVLFQDIRSSENVVVSLKHLKAEEIAEKMRLTFSIIMKASQMRKNPIQAIVDNRNTENFYKAGNSIISGVKNISGKTIEAVMNAIVESTIK